MASASYPLSPTGRDGWGESITLAPIGGEGWGEGADSFASSVSGGTGSHGSPDLLVLLPVKDLARAKLRLARVLGPNERRALALAMLEDVVGAVQGAGLVPSVLTPDDDVAAFADKRGARVLRQSPTTRSLNAALTHAIKGHEGAVLVLLPDIPLVAPSEIRALVSACSMSRTAIALAPDRSGIGTNGLLLSHPEVVPMCFGRHSHARFLHAAEAGSQRSLSLLVVEGWGGGASHAVEVSICRQPGIALDVDTPADLRELLSRPADTATHRLLGQIAPLALLATDARTT